MGGMVASRKKNCAYGSLDSIVCIKGGMSLPVVTCHNRPPKKNRGKVTASRGWFWHILDEWTNFADFWRWGLLNLWQGFGVIHTEKFIKNPYICTLHVHNHFYNYDYSITQKLNACVDARWKHGSGS